jgi:hypothetical protein
MGLFVEEKKITTEIDPYFFQYYHSLLADDKTNSKNSCIRRLPKEITDSSSIQDSIMICNW